MNIKSRLIDFVKTIDFGSLSRIIVTAVLAIICFLGFFICLGSLGNIDFAVETGEILTKEQETFNYIRAFGGIILFGLGAFGLKILD